MAALAGLVLGVLLLAWLSQELLQIRASAGSASEIAGPLAGGLLVVAAGPGCAIGVDGATFAFSAVCLTMLRVPGRPQRDAGGFLSDLREGWDAFTARTWVWTFVVYFAVANTFWGAWTALGPVVADRDLGGAAAWGTVLAALGLGALGAVCSPPGPDHAGRSCTSRSWKASSHSSWPSWLPFLPCPCWPWGRSSLAPE